jgi:hypothetical protein
VDKFTCDIDGYPVRFFLFAIIPTAPSTWCWNNDDIPSSVDFKAFEITQLLDHNPAVQAWLSCRQYGGMTLEEFLESTQTEVA